MEDTRGSVILLMLVLSIILRLNGTILVLSRRKKVPWVLALMLNIISPVMCIVLVSYTTSGTYTRDWKSPRRSVLVMLLTFIGSQFLTGSVFSALLILAGVPIPTGRAVGPGSNPGLFLPAYLFFILAHSSLVLIASLRILEPRIDPMSFFKGKRLTSTSAASLLALGPVIAIGTLAEMLLDGRFGTSGAGLFMRPGSGEDMLYLFMAVVVLAPIAEEILFRGYLFDRIGGTYGPRTAVVVTSALFALAHLSPVTVVPLFLMGLIMGWARARTGSIIPSLTVHSINNAMALLVLWI